MARSLALLAAALFLGGALRLYNIEVRPLQSDEGVNYYFIRQLRKDGFVSYSESQFHGPLYFYTAGVFANLVAQRVCEERAPACFKDSEFGMRLGSVVVGLLMILTPLILRGVLESPALIMTSFLFASSPLLVFYSRTGIHESLFLLISLVIGFTFYKFLEMPRMIYVMTLALAAALLVATKETFTILFIALLAAGFARKGAFLKELPLLLPGILLFAGAIFILFGGEVQALLIPFKGVAAWFEKGIGPSPHGNPWYYYLGVLYSVAPLGCLGLGCALILSLQNNDRGLKYFGIWALAVFVIYSAIPYKTPWLSINFLAPSLICLALVIARISATRIRYLLFISVFLVDLFLTSSLVFSNDRDFSKEIYESDTYSDVRNISSAVNSYCQGADCRIYIGLKYYWPLPFYLQNHYDNIAYDPKRTFDDVKDQVRVVMLPEVPRDLPAGWTMVRYNLSPLQKVILLAKN